MPASLPLHPASGTRAQSAAVIDSSAPRVLIAVDAYPSDSREAAHFTRQLISELAAKGHEVHLVCPSDRGRPRVERVDGVIVYRLRSLPALMQPTRRVVMRLGLRTCVERLIDRIAPDVLHVQSHSVIGRAVAGAARRAGLPVVADTSHRLLQRVRAGQGLRLDAKPVTRGVDPAHVRPSGTLTEGTRARFRLPCRDKVPGARRQSSSWARLSVAGLGLALAMLATVHVPGNRDPIRDVISYYAFDSATVWPYYSWRAVACDRHVRLGHRPPPAAAAG
uniref:8-AzgK n=1 Tax=Streptomyces pathocidini TaxID=1650571 RepID=A0A7G3ZQC9_9ACTN|nr:8-AzgK [Streptomyces pathocidini]